MTHLVTEHRVVAQDGTPLFYRAWRPARRTTKALVLFHRGHEHSGRFADLVERLGLEDFSLFAWDARGHGRSPGERGYAPRFSTLASDADAFVRQVCDQEAIDLENLAVLSTSVGSVVACAWVHDYAPPIRALVLANPAFRIKLYIPLALPMLRLKRSLFGNSFVKSYVSARMLTHDPQERERYDKDPLITRSISAGLLLDLFDVSKRLVDDAGAIRVPTLLQTSGSDWVVRNQEQRAFFERLGSALKEKKDYPGFYHALFHEKEKERPIADAREFILRAFARPADRVPRAGSDPGSPSQGQYERLARPLRRLSPRSWTFAGQRLALKTLGRLSEGIRRGWRTGFDSGESLDYVYENRPRGRALVGPVIDRVYLNSVGWRGIRQRKANLQRVLRALVADLGTAETPLRLLDIASGPGRYLLEILRESPPGTTALLRDYSSAAVEAGRALARELGVSGAAFDRGDAFDTASLAGLSPKAHIAIASGLYELFPENDRVRASVRGVFGALAPGGHFVYTNQPWHPQVEMIARVLVNREGKPWVMRCRSQVEMDDLVREAGFQKASTVVDEFGIFTVSVARKGSA